MSSRPLTSSSIKMWTPARTTLFGYAAALAILVFCIASSPILIQSLKFIYLMGVLLFAGCYAAVVNWREPNRPVFGPVQILLVSMFLKLVLAPLLHVFYGQQQGNYPTSPSSEAAQLAQLIYIAVALAASAGYLLAFRPPRREVPWRSDHKVLPFVITTGLMGALASYVLKLADVENTAVSFVVAMARVLTPLAVVSVIFRNADRLRFQPTSIPAAIVALCLTVVLLLDNNRAIMIYPVIALAAVYALYNRRIRIVHLVGLALLLLVFWFAAGQVRERSALGNVEVYASERVLTASDAAYSLSNYIGSAIFGGFALDNTANRQGTLLPSLLESLPVWGEGFRNQSGSALYNRAVYDHRGIRDQIYPAPVEVYRNTGIWGVLVFYFGVGSLIGLLQRKFETSQPGNFIQAYAAAYLAILLCASVNLSLSVLGQFTFYNAVPIVALWIWARARSSADSVPPKSAILAK